MNTEIYNALSRIEESLCDIHTSENLLLINHNILTALGSVKEQYDNKDRQGEALLAHEISRQYDSLMTLVEIIQEKLIDGQNRADKNLQVLWGLLRKEEQEQ